MIPTNWHISLFKKYLYKWSIYLLNVVNRLLLKMSEMKQYEVEEIGNFQNSCLQIS